MFTVYASHQVSAKSYTPCLELSAETVEELKALLDASKDLGDRRGSELPVRNGTHKVGSFTVKEGRAPRQGAPGSWLVYTAEFSPD